MADGGSDMAVRPNAHFGNSRHLTPDAHFVELRRRTSDVRIRVRVADVESVSFDKACRTYCARIKGASVLTTLCFESFVYALARRPREPGLLNVAP